MIGLYIFAGIVALSGVEVYQYFRGRRMNMEMIRDSIRILEETFRPVDKEYQMVGLYVGYRAKLIRNEEPKNIIVSFLTLPRYSTLYYPISRILNKGDRVMMVLNYEKDIGRGEVHLCDKKFAKKMLEDSEKNLNIRELKCGMKILYEDPITAKIFEETFSGVYTYIRHVAYDPSSRCIYLYANFSNLNEFKEIMCRVSKLASRLL
ncbi:MAG: hypothetical protein GXO26_04835 [Crenarchaeota archaeon]|nr:hypothetical protein [Thermoproteota archaeon]